MKRPSESTTEYHQRLLALTAEQAEHLPMDEAIDRIRLRQAQKEEEEKQKAEKAEAERKAEAEKKTKAAEKEKKKAKGLEKAKELEKVKELERTKADRGRSRFKAFGSAFGRGSNAEPVKFSFPLQDNQDKRKLTMNIPPSTNYDGRKCDILQVYTCVRRASLYSTKIEDLDRFSVGMFVTVGTKLTGSKPTGRLAEATSPVEAIEPIITERSVRGRTGFIPLRKIGATQYICWSRTRIVTPFVSLDVSWGLPRSDSCGASYLKIEEPRNAGCIGAQKATGWRQSLILGGVRFGVEVVGWKKKRSEGGPSFVWMWI
ncbi:hypothetical protein B0H19DRAFT_1065720 [Mycena capillaripes]|nr:hypothetical protein B0H19DRAFT_1065720 [Mycena capillaripes]